MKPSFGDNQAVMGHRISNHLPGRPLDYDRLPMPTQSSTYERMYPAHVSGSLTLGEDMPTPHRAPAQNSRSERDELEPRNNPVFLKKFNIYRRRLGSGTYTIGPHRTVAQSLVNIHSRLSPLPPIVLYLGPVERKVPLTTVEGSCPNWKINIFDPINGKALCNELLQEERCYAGPNFSKFKFCVEIGDRGRRELFEWRNVGCWQLVRQSSRLFKKKNRANGPSFETDNAVSTARDNEEVVAKMLHIWGRSKLQAEVRVTGSGATGSLGQKWEIMAVASALTIFRQVRRHSLRPDSKRTPHSWGA